MPSSESGIYKIEVEGEKIKVRCEMRGNSTGLTVSYICSFILQNVRLLIDNKTINVLIN